MLYIRELCPTLSISSVDGKRNGKGKFYRQDGTVEYEGDFVDGKWTQTTPTVESDQPRTLDVCLKELHEMIGLNTVKEKVQALVNHIRLQDERKARNLVVTPMTYHFVFYGNPGTGKTTVARLLSEIFSQLGIVSKGTLVETDRAGLVGGYIGQTAIKTDKVIQEALGGILFIDEAYALKTRQEDSYGQEAIDCIMKRMEDYRDDLVVIVAGYQEPMDKFLESNPGLKSRFNQYITFANYTITELIEIFQGFCQKNGYSVEPACEALLAQSLNEKPVTNVKNFSNGRFVRNIFEKMILAQGNRLSRVNLSTTSNEALTMLTVQDLQDVIADRRFERTY